MRVRVSASAFRDLGEIHDYWAERANPDVARDLIHSITARFALFAESPKIGRRCNDLAPGLRCFPVWKYLVYFRKQRGAIEILHVFHGAKGSTPRLGPGMTLGFMP